ncbi:hypothetical protein LCGC14_0821110 [marine sediment metagenome]|uniref:HNH nuclease domain-containing protein n=1 Tax=marine sediment metagenome TaxID=412755 RepID=A0A0F9S3Q4_9ZZZZ
MTEYTGICEVCSRDFVYQRNSKIYPSSNFRKRCTSCRRVYKKPTYNSRWRTESRYLKSTGYFVIRVDGHYVAEHRYVMEQMLGRKLRKGEMVHHKDGNKTNNAPQNLEVWMNTHSFGIRASDLICPHCGKSYIPISSTISEL